MGQALYRQYRPRSLKEVAGQDHVTQALTRAIANQQISHAYLFTGPRGVGKTSIARILAHEINNLPYEDDSTHIDIIEIDAASNRRIDEIRELRDKVYVSPTQAKYKVYIIDEVHMLTKEAFNALLKTLEEPPAHVVFILATTDAHKLPETIVSRTQRYSFKPLTTSEAVKQLSKIADKEKIKVSPDALELIAQHGEGSLRDSLSLLDQARAYSDSVDLATIAALLGLPPAEAITKLLDSIASSTQPAEIVGQLSDLYDQGYPAAVIAKELSSEIRQKLINNDLTLDTQTALKLLNSLLAVPASANPNRYLEITLLQVRPQAQVSQPVAAEPQTDKVPPAETEPATKEEPKAKLPIDDSLWLEILEAIKQKHNTLYGVVRMAEPHFISEDNLELSFGFDFHKKKLSEAGNKQLLINVIKELTGKKVKIDCKLDKNAKPLTTKPEKKPEADDLSAISNIFNGAELLES